MTVDLPRPFWERPFGPPARFFRGLVARSRLWVRSSIHKWLVPMTTSYHALPTEQQRVWKMQRWFVAPRRRWLFEGSMRLPGQLWFADRDLLCWAVHSRKPRIVMEVGTWRGGGSTLFVAQSLYENGAGILHTVDIDPEMVARAQAGYARHLPHLMPFIRFHVGVSTEIYPPLLTDLRSVDIVFLDGGDSPERSLAELEMFTPFLRSGSLLVAHDWFTAKMALVRPLVVASPRWKVVKALAPPFSVGLVVAEYQPGGHPCGSDALAPGFKEDESV